MKHSKGYRKAAELIEEGKVYTPLEAAKIAKESSPTKFDATVEVALRLGVDPRKADQMVRGTVSLPHGTGKTARVIVFATGYRISFPFFKDADLLPDENHRFPLFKRMMKPGIPNLFFMGLAQPLPTLVNFAEQQAKLVGAYLSGRYAPPSAKAMAEITVKDEATHLGPYYQSARHTIQVDFGLYVHDLLKEIERGEKRAKAVGYRLPVPGRVVAASAAVAAE